MPGKKGVLHGGEGKGKSQLAQHGQVPAPRVSRGASEPGLPPASASSLEGSGLF